MLEDLPWAPPAITSLLAIFLATTPAGMGLLLQSLHPHCRPSPHQQRPCLLVKCHLCDSIRTPKSVSMGAPGFLTKSTQRRLSLPLPPSASHFRASLPAPRHSHTHPHLLHSPSPPSLGPPPEPGISFISGRSSAPPTLARGSVTPRRSASREARLAPLLTCPGSSLKAGHEPHSSLDQLRDLLPCTDSNRKDQPNSCCPRVTCSQSSSPLLDSSPERPRHSQNLISSEGERTQGTCSAAVRPATASAAQAE